MALQNIGKFRKVLAPVQQSTEIVELKKRARARRRSPEAMYLTEEELHDLFSVIVSKRDKAIFRLVYHRGLRAHEVGLLTTADWRNRDGILYIHRGKGSIGREHSLTDEELKTLRAWMKERGPFPGVLFPSRQGRRGISRYRLDQLMKGYCKKAGIDPEKAHMHVLKHSCGTHLAERGYSADEIQDHLGHRDISSTNIYMHFSNKRRAGMAERLKDWR